MAIIKIFVKNNQKSNSSFEGKIRANIGSNPNFLTDPYKIKKLLQELEKQSPLCTITIAGSKEEFSSSILDVETTAKIIILDELFPQHGNTLIDDQKKIKLSTHYNGIHLAFNLSNIQFGSADDITYYKVDFPTRIYYPQRRKGHRISLQSAHIIFSGIATKNNTSMGGYVFDLSRGGISITLSDDRARIRRGDTIKNCSIRLNDYNMSFDLSVRCVKKIGSLRRQTNIGGYFENISSKSQNKLSYFITSLEREELKKQKT